MRNFLHVSSQDVTKYPRHILKFTDPPSLDAGNALSHAVLKAIWHASRHACFLSERFATHLV